MMKTFPLRFLAALALACSGLSNCSMGINGGGGPVDVVNPTVSQIDDLDVRWGLPRRVSKSTASRRVSAAPALGSSAAVENTQPAPAAPGNVSN